MKKLSLLLVLFSTSFYAQTFNWSTEPTKIENESENRIEHVFDGGKLYKMRTIYNEKVYNTDIFVDIFDSKDSFEKDTENLSVEQPPMGMNMLTFLDQFYVSGKNYAQFYSEFNRSTKELELFYQNINIDTKSKSKLALVTKIVSKNGSNPGNFYMAQSPNKLFYVILKQLSYDKKVNEKIAFCLLDASFKVVKEMEYEFPFNSKESGNQTLAVSNTGNVFMIKEVNLPKLEPSKSLYFWNSATNIITEKSLKLENDMQINQFKGQFIGDDFLIQGFYSEKQKSFQIRFGDPSNGVGIFAAKFTANGDLTYIMTNPTEKFKDIFMKDALVEGNKTWVLFDQISKNSRRLPAADPSKPFERFFEHNFDSKGVTIGMIDNSTGKLDWITDIKNDERGTTNDNAAFFSGLYFVKNKTISVIYNDIRDVGTGILAHYSRFPVLQTLDSTGKIITTRDLTDSGAGCSKANCFELDTSFKVLSSENTYIVRSKCGDKAKYGYLKF
jgi:hypothetical protein